MAGTRITSPERGLSSTSAITVSVAGGVLLIAGSRYPEQQMKLLDSER